MLSVSAGVPEVRLRAERSSRYYFAGLMRNTMFREWQETRMPRNTLLTENNVHNWVGEAQFNRGMRYVSEGLIQPGIARGKIIRGWCLPRDNQPGSYFVWARMLGIRIGEAHCTCPLGKHGICPHVAAVLIHFVREPELYQRSIWQRLFGPRRQPAARPVPAMQQVA